MDYTSFRTAIGGFNRADVFAYIEKTSHEHRSALREKDQQLAALQGELDALRKEREELQREVASLQAQLQAQPEAAPQEAPAPEASDSRELEAYRRAEAAERSAHVRAARLNGSLNALLSSTQAQLDALTDDTRSAALQVEQELQNVQNCSARSMALLKELTEQLAALTDDTGDTPDVH